MIFFYSCFEHYVLIRFLFLKVISHDEKTEFKEKAEYLVSYVSDMVLIQEQVSQFLLKCW